MFIIQYQSRALMCWLAHAISVQVYSCARLIVVLCHLQLGMDTTPLISALTFCLFFHVHVVIVALVSNLLCSN